MKNKILQIMYKLSKGEIKYNLASKQVLDLFSVSGSLRPVLLLASYCGEEDSNCTDANPCEECLKMCNIAFIEKDAIKSDNVVCGYDFMEDYR